MSSMPRITRREVVAAGMSGAALAAVPNAWAARLLDKTPRIGPGQFLDGVASGEPSARAVTLWSRLETDRLRSGARLVVAKDKDLRQVVSNTVVPTGRGINGTLKARIGGLEPREEYFYKFISGSDESPVGRTLTAPAPGSAEPLRVGFSSCQNYPFGFFATHRDAVAQSLDLQLFLGDYMYETRESGPVRPDDIETTDLESYRAKYRRYRAEPELRELHRLVPMAHIWDDHEVADNYNEPEEKRATAQQRAFAYRVAFEWLPRMTMPQERFRIYRKLSYGDMLDVFLLDTRQYRTGAGTVAGSPTQGGGQGSPLLGPEQLAWLLRELRASKAKWKLIAQQIVVATIYYIGNTVQNPDAWDGHQAERDAILDAIAGPDPANPAIDNVVWITGDVHAFIANNLPTRFDQVRYTAGQTPPVSTEYVGGSVTSPGIPDAPRSPRAPWNELYDAETRGYGVMRFTEGRLDTDFRGAPAFPSRETPVNTLYSFTQESGANRIQTVPPRPSRTR
jgi:phosphodiesterase/alkaline phosphatase D-like protein